MADVKAMMDEETWMTAADALKDGFCTEVSDGKPEGVESLAMARTINLLGRFKKVPNDMKPKAGRGPLSMRVRLLPELHGR